MKALFLVIIIVVHLVFTLSCFGQAGGAALLFLLISPSAETNGTAEASVASGSNDPLASVTNPACIGMQSQTMYFWSGYNHSDWLPGFRQPDLWYRTYAFNAGINLRKLFGSVPELSIGFGYSNIRVNEGQFVIVGPDSPAPLGTYTAYESSDQYTIGAGIDCLVRASAGITFKHIVSSLANYDVLGNGRMGVDDVNAYDYGLLFVLPFAEVLHRVAGAPVHDAPRLVPLVDFNFGLAVNNLGGDKVMYIDASQADPLPRYARAGIGLRLGLEYRKGGTLWQPFSFKWMEEANDLLVRRYLKAQGGDTTSAWEYQDGLGDIKFFDEVILGHGNPKTIKKRGWELNLFEVFSIRGGRFEESPEQGGRQFTTSGFGVQLAGFVRLFRVVNRIAPPGENSGLLLTILTHLDVRYNHSSLSANSAISPLANTTFDSINLLVFN